MLDFRERYQCLLRDVILELQKIIRDKGKCLGFGNFEKINWIPFDDRIALVLSRGRVLWCWMTVGEKLKPILQPGKEIEVLDSVNGIRLSCLIDFIEKNNGECK